MKHMFKSCVALMNKLTNYPTLGSENSTVVDMLVSTLLVISPLLQHYKGVVVNAGILVLILCLPYVCLKLLFRLRSLQWKNVLFALPLVLFQMFRVFAHGTSFMEVAHAAVLCGYFVAIALGGINLKCVARSAYLVAMAAGIAIMTQAVCYYLFDFHLQLVATELLLEESHSWVKLAQTGIIGVTGNASAFYRPSAFFLEPSHMFLYFVPNLFLLLLTPDMNWVKRISATILSIGLILSTSGMGIAVVVAAWLLHLGFGKGKENLLRFKHLFSKQNILRCIAFVIVFSLIALALPFLRYSIMRVFMGSQAVNAIIAEEKAEKAAEVAEYFLTEQENVDPENISEEQKLALEEALKNAEETAQAAEEAKSVAEETTGSTAISGRTERAISLILNRMSDKQYLGGVADSADVNFNLPGFFATMYKYGIIGTLLSYIFYLYCAIFAKGAYRWMATIILVISFFSAHTHGTFYMLYYVLILMSSVVPRSVKESTPLQSIE